MYVLRYQMCQMLEMTSTSGLRQLILGELVGFGPCSRLHPELRRTWLRLMLCSSCIPTPCNSFLSSQVLLVSSSADTLEECFPYGTIVPCVVIKCAP